MGGSQQQLDAMIAETTVPILAIPSARPVRGEFASVGSFNELVVAPGDFWAVVAQQSWAFLATGWGSLDMHCLLVIISIQNRNANTQTQLANAACGLAAT